MRPEASRGRPEDTPVTGSPAVARVAGLRLFVSLCLSALPGLAALLAGACLAPGTATAAAPATRSDALRSAVSGASGTWVVLPMGQLGDPSNTFWQLVHAAPGSSHWSVVTPEGVADNGGIVAGVSPISVDAGILPSGLLRFSPLARSTDGGRTWNPAFLPGALAALPDALAGPPAGAGTALAVVGRSVLNASAGLSSWSRTTSVAALAATWPRCGATAIDAVAVTPDGVPMVATDCRRDGRVGIFTRARGTWSPTGPVLGGRLLKSSTEVLRLEPTAEQDAALVLATAAGRRSLVVLWSAPHGRWTESAALTLPSASTVASTAVGAGGTVAALVSGPGGVVPFTISPGTGWSRLPSPPRGSVAVAVAPQTGATVVGFDAFTVSGALLGVYTTTAAGSAWVEVQSIRVPLAYGSSS